MQERWMADRATLYRLIRLHPEWTQKELAAWIGRSVGWVKKWVKRFREVPPGDGSVLARKTTWPHNALPADRSGGARACHCHS
jgi:hypothetical protein